MRRTKRHFRPSRSQLLGFFFAFLGKFHWRAPTTPRIPPQRHTVLNSFDTAFSQWATRTPSILCVNCRWSPYIFTLPGVKIADHRTPCQSSHWTPPSLTADSHSVVVAPSSKWIPALTSGHWMIAFLTHSPSVGCHQQCQPTSHDTPVYR